MPKTRAIVQAGPLHGTYYYTIQQKSWFWGWEDVGHVWAKTPAEALNVAIARTHA